MFGITELRPVLHASLQFVTQLMLSRTVMPARALPVMAASSPRRSPRAVWSYLRYPAGPVQLLAGLSQKSGTRARLRFVA